MNAPPPATSEPRPDAPVPPEPVGPAGSADALDELDVLNGLDASDALDVLEIPLDLNLGEACHAMLLRLAGRAPDGLMTETRRWLAAHDAVSVARAVASCAVGTRMPLAAPDALLVRALLAGAGLDTAQADKIETIEEEPPVDHRFVPVEPDVAEANADRLGHCLDLTVPPAPGRPAGLVDELDVGAARAAAGIPGAVALWRAWRYPADAAPWPGPRRVHLLAVDPEAGAEAEGETDPEASAYAAAAKLQAGLEALGERDPQVEAFALDDELPSYQRTARARSALLWTKRRSVPIRLAGVYDVADGPEGPGFSEARVRLEGDERTRVADFLAQGTLLLATTARLDDVLDPAAGAGRVPVNFRTDGTWVWNDAAQYYVEKHGVSPEPDLLEHVRAAGSRPEVPDALGVFRALAALTSPGS